MKNLLLFLALFVGNVYSINNIQDLYSLGNSLQKKLAEKGNLYDEAVKAKANGDVFTSHAITNIYTYMWHGDKEYNGEFLISLKHFLDNYKEVVNLEFVRQNLIIEQTVHAYFYYLILNPDDNEAKEFLKSWLEKVYPEAQFLIYLDYLNGQLDLSRIPYDDLIYFHEIAVWAYWNVGEYESAKKLASKNKKSMMHNCMQANDLFNSKPEKSLSYLDKCFEFFEKKWSVNFKTSPGKAFLILGPIRFNLILQFNVLRARQYLAISPYHEVSSYNPEKAYWHTLFGAVFINNIETSYLYFYSEFLRGNYKIIKDYEENEIRRNLNDEHNLRLKRGILGLKYSVYAKENNPSKYEKYATEAFNLGSEIAGLDLAMDYLEGTFLKKDVEKGIEIYTKLATNGNKKAKEALTRAYIQHDLIGNEYRFSQFQIGIVSRELNVNEKLLTETIPFLAFYEQSPNKIFLVDKINRFSDLSKKAKESGKVSLGEAYTSIGLAFLNNGRIYDKDRGCNFLKQAVRKKEDYATYIRAVNCLSDNKKTYERDLKNLSEKGYSIASITLADFYSQEEKFEEAEDYLTLAESQGYRTSLSLNSKENMFSLKDIRPPEAVIQEVEDTIKDYKIRLAIENENKERLREERRKIREERNRKAAQFFQGFGEVLGMFVISALDAAVKYETYSAFDRNVNVYVRKDNPYGSQIRTVPPRKKDDFYQTQRKIIQYRSQNDFQRNSKRLMDAYDGIWKTQ